MNKPTAKQLAARKLFAKRAKAGEFKRATKKTKVRTNPTMTRADINAARVREAAKHLAKLVDEGFSFKQAEAIVLRQSKLTHPASIKAVQTKAAELLRKPNPVKKTRKTATRAPSTRRSALTSPRSKMPIVSIDVDVNSHNAGKAGKTYNKNPARAKNPITPRYVVRAKGAMLAHFVTQTHAKQYAQAYADSYNIPVTVEKS